MMKGKRICAVFVIITFLLTMVTVSIADEPAKLDLNKATIGDLVKIKGIGEKYAERIIEYRDENGLFVQTEDIMKVKGIGEKTFESIKDFIMVEKQE